MTTVACLAPDVVVAAAMAPSRLSLLCGAFLALPASATPLPAGDYAALLLLTLAFEAPVYLLVGRLVRRSPAASALMLLGANLATHPAVIYLLPRLAVAFGLDLAATTLMQEGFAIAVEACLLSAVWRLSWPTAVLGSMAANLTSWWLGILLQAGNAGP